MRIVQENVAPARQACAVSADLLRPVERVGHVRDRLHGEKSRPGGMNTTRYGMFVGADRRRESRSGQRSVAGGRQPAKR